MSKPNYIDRVKNPLGLIVFGTLILETFIGAVILNFDSYRLELIILMVSFVFVMVLVSLGVSWFKPEALKGERYIITPQEQRYLQLQEQLKELESRLSTGITKYVELSKENIELKKEIEEKSIKVLEYQILYLCSSEALLDSQTLYSQLGVLDGKSKEARQIDKVVASLKANGRLLPHFS